MNENRVVESTTNEQRSMDHRVVTVLVLFGLSVICFLLVALSALTSAKVAFIALFVICGVAVVSWYGGRIHDRWILHKHHKHDMLDRDHLRELTRIAIAHHHSVEFNPVTRQLRTISPWTIPNAAITIKDNQFGQGELAAVLPVAPAFHSLISHIRPGHLFLAQGADNKPIWGDITDLLSTLDVGRPGTGKSTLLRMVCGQVLLIGGKSIIMDPHGSILDDLGSEFECAESPRDIAQYSHMLDRQLTERLARRRGGQGNFQPLLLLVDEMPIISEMSQEALAVIRRVVLEGRKVGMYALVSGQGVPASILGSTLVRDAMSSRYVFHTTPAQARMAGIETEASKQYMSILETAGPGKAVLATASRRAELVAIPDTTTDDIRFILDRKRVDVATTNLPPTYHQPQQFGGSENEPVEPLVVESQKSLSVRESRVLDMLRAQSGQNEIIESIWGVTYKQGRAYQNAVDEYRAIVAKIVAESEDRS